MSLPPAARTIPSPQSPYSPGSWGIPVKHLEWEGPQSGQGQGPAGVGVGFLLCPYPFPPSCPPILIYPPLETEDLLFSIIYNLKLGPPVLSSPLT